MKIETKYSYEKQWALTNENELLNIIAQEVGEADPKGTLMYILDVIKNDKVITVGSCKFRKANE